MPGPIAPRPVARPSVSALDASTMLPSSATWPPVWEWCLVLGLRGVTDVDAGQQGEDERLQSGHQQPFEHVEEEGERNPEDAQKATHEDRETRGHDDEQVAGEHVCQESYREADESQHLGQQLEHEDERRDRLAGPRGNLRPEVAHEAV